MGFFTKETKEDALHQIRKINSEMRAISASMHLNYGMIDGRNRKEIKSHFNNIISFTKKYEKIKHSFSDVDQFLFEGDMVQVWNGEQVEISTWEDYLRNTLNRLYNDINY